MRIQRLITAGAAAAAGLYGGIAAATWVRYGHPRVSRASLLDRYLPEPDVVERHSIKLNVPPATAFDVSSKFDLMHSRLARLLFATRAMLLCAPIEDGAPRAGLIDQMQAMGWIVLDEIPGREIILGAAAKPWLAEQGFRSIPREQFAAFNEPGWAKIVWQFHVEPTQSGSIVRTETRIVAIGADARRLFRRYWSLALPGIVLIGLFSLKSIKKQAEERRLRERLAVRG